MGEMRCPFCGHYMVLELWNPNNPAAVPGGGQTVWICTFRCAEIAARQKESQRGGGK